MNKITSFFIGSALLIPAIAVSQSLPTFSNPESLSLAAGAVSRSGEFGDIITEAPAGTTKKLVRSGCSYYVNNSGQRVDTYQNMMSEIVFADNGEVYLKNPISRQPTGSYLKGYQEGNTLVFDLPQAIWIDDFFGREMIVTTLQFSEVYWNYAAANTTISAEGGLPEIDNKWVLQINEDGSYSYLPDIRDDGYAATMIGLVYSDAMSWNGFAEVYSDWAPFTAEPLSAPEGLEVSKAEMRTGATAYLGSIGFDGDDVYVRGLFDIMPDSWIKGTRKGDKVSFLSDQFLGGAEAYNFYGYFVAGDIVELGDGNRTIVKTDSIEFTYDEAAGTLISAEDKAVVCNAGSGDIAVLGYMNSPYIVIQPENISQIPADPYDLSFTEGWAWGPSSITFCLPEENVDGRLLNPDNLYYTVFFDGEPYTFIADDYYFMNEDMTLIPFGYVDGWDFGRKGNSRTISLYFEGADDFGIQLYTIVDGVTVGESAVVTKQISSGVEENIASAATVVSTAYHDLTGREVSASFKGMRVKTVKYSDGTVRTYKEIAR